MSLIEQKNMYSFGFLIWFAEKEPEEKSINLLASDEEEARRSLVEHINRNFPEYTRVRITNLDVYKVYFE